MNRACLAKSTNLHEQNEHASSIRPVKNNFVRMKNSVVLLLLIFGSTLYGQTDSIEKDILYKKILSKEIGQLEYSRIALKWNQTIKEFGIYPELPLDINGQIHYLFLYKFIGLNKETLFNRTLEWLSINYGLVPSYLYSNLEDGKIIFRNSLNIGANYTCAYTSVISIKNEKILMEIINISYQVYYEGQYSNNEWVPEKTMDFSLSENYPVILKDPAVWKANLLWLKTVDERFSIEKKNLYDYITIVNYPDEF
jgi:hypothetical protein